MQRKRHINFKYWRKAKVESSTSTNGHNSIQNKLHSIPILIRDSKCMKKSNVLYSIPCGCVLAFLLVGAISLIRHTNAYAWVIPSQMPATDFSTVTPISSASLPATASLSLSKTNLTSDTATPGNTATASTNVTIKVSNAENYSLTLKMDRDTLINGSTTIIAGNVTTDNTWGYKWDNAGSYSAPSTAATILTTPALTNNATDFTKTLTFAAKFANTAESGHYKANGTLSLVATPKSVPLTLADLTQMQQLSLVPEACANTPYLSGQNYSAEYTLSDVRDDSTYTVRKLGDGKCWMTQNLKFINSKTEGSDTYTYAGRTLNSATSDVSKDFTLPDSSVTGFSGDDTIINYYLSNNTGYFTWCAATAGTCPSTGEASSSVCPKGWKLPRGYNNTNSNNDFWNMFRNIGLTISNTSLAATINGYTDWGTNDLAKVQSSPYNLTYTGWMGDSSTDFLTANGGYWWSRTAHDSNIAYSLSFNESSVYPGTNAYGRRYGGFAVRCVAEQSSDGGHYDVYE